MRRLHCQLPADNGYVVLIFGAFPSDLCFTGMGINVLMLVAHRRARKLLTDYIHEILTFHSMIICFIKGFQHKYP